MGSRWLDETGGTRGASYDEAFRELAASGADVHGEARFVAELLPEGAKVLDAGCGTGRVGAELARRRFDVVGVDSDASMLEVARDLPGVEWLEGDLATLDLDDRFHGVVMAGNVVVFVDPGTEQQVVDRCAAHLLPGGLLVSGWDTSRLAVPDYDALVAAAGLEPVARHATWDGDPWTPEATWCVAVDRLPEPDAADDAADEAAAEGAAGAA